MFAGQWLWVVHHCLISAKYREFAGNAFCRKLFEKIHDEVIQI